MEKSNANLILVAALELNRSLEEHLKKHGLKEKHGEIVVSTLLHALSSGFGKGLSNS